MGAACTFQGTDEVHEISYLFEVINNAGSLGLMAMMYEPRLHQERQTSGQASVTLLSSCDLVDCVEGTLLVSSCRERASKASTRADTSDYLNRD